MTGLERLACGHPELTPEWCGQAICCRCLAVVTRQLESWMLDRFMFQIMNPRAHGLIKGITG